MGLLEVEFPKIDRILNTLLDHGVNLIDTASSYAGSEEAIGKAIGHRRGEYVLVSKCGSGKKEFTAPQWSEEHLTQSIDRSLLRLKTDCIDVMLLHSCDLDLLRKGDVIATLNKARDAGKIRFGGYSGDNDAAVYAAGLPDIAVLETSISLADQMNIDAVLPVTRKNDVGVLAKRPLANAAWKQRDQQPGFYKDYAAPYYERMEKMQLKPSQLGFPDDGNDAWLEMALRFTLSQEGLHTAIIGTTSIDHVTTNIAAANKGPLPPEMVRQIRETFRNADPDGTWTAQN